MKVQNNDIIDYLLQSGSSKAKDKKNSFDEILSDYRKELNMALTSQTLLEKQNSLGKNTNNSVNLSSVLNELGLV